MLAARLTGSTAIHPYRKKDLAENRKSSNAQAITEDQAREFARKIGCHLVEGKGPMGGFKDA